MQDLIKLHHGSIHNLIVEPRWPQNYVYIDAKALNSLIQAQNILSHELQLSLTRGYQKEGTFLRSLRRIGAFIFIILYPSRKNEVWEIFRHNGHALDGTHVDIGVYYKGKKITLLPFGVFTSIAKINVAEEMYSKIIIEVKEALLMSGFIIHENKTEALQIHCDLRF